MITPSFSLTATERVLPKLALDFTTATLDSRITFTRALATATRVNGSGFIETVAADTPRFDYDPVTLACKGLLIEESRSNLFTYSENFENAIWTRPKATISSDAVIAPNGTTSADKFIANAVSGFKSIEQTLAVTEQAYTMSVFAKAAEVSVLQLLWSGGASTNYANFNLATGAVSAGTYTSASITNFGNGWYRCTLTSTLVAGNYSGILSLQGSATSARAAAYTGDGVKGLYIWGAQMEVGAFPTSYIPTTSAALTRNADVATMTGYGVVDQGTFVIDATVVSGKTLITSGSVTFAATASTAQKTAVAYNVTSVKKSINAQTVTSAAGATASVDISIGPSSDGYFRKMFFYLPKLTDAELQSFSK